MTRYLILDLPEDYPILSKKVEGDSWVIPISAVAAASLKNTKPQLQTVELSSVITQEQINTLVESRAQKLLQHYFADDHCAYYKVKQIIDACIEKQVIVEALSTLPGQKYFVDAGTIRLSVEVELPESMRLAALYMRTEPDFVAVQKKRQSWFRKTCIDVLRLAYQTVKHRSTTSSGPLIIASGYNTAEQFPSSRYRYLSNGHLFLALLKQSNLPVNSRLKNIFEVIRLFLPVRLAASELAEHSPHVALVNSLFKHSRTIHRVIGQLAQSSWSATPWMFTVYYPSLITIAMVRSARDMGIPVISMQHAIVGHDNWLASRYIDAYVSDAKLVSSAHVANQLQQIEQTNVDYIPASLPHFTQRQSTLRPWNGKSITYVMTGFTRTNTMYDNRRMNDWFYYQACAYHIAVLKNHFVTRVRPHPFDQRHYGNVIIDSLVNSVETVTGPFENCGTAIVMNSPTTSFGDAVRMGMHVFVVNLTCTLRDDFKAKATEYAVFHETIEQLTAYIKRTPSEDIAARQTAFRDWFLPLYLGGDTLPQINEAIENWYSAQGFND